MDGLRIDLTKPCIILESSLTSAMSSCASALLMIFDASAIYNCVRNSAAEPFAILRNLTNSALESRSAPSAILDAIESEDLVIWSLKPKFLQKMELFHYNSHYLKQGY